jgi:hypothetical protein
MAFFAPVVKARKARRLSLGLSRAEHIPRPSALSVGLQNAGVFVFLDYPVGVFGSDSVLLTEPVCLVFHVHAFVIVIPIIGLASCTDSAYGLCIRWRRPVLIAFKLSNRQGQYLGTYRAKTAKAAIAALLADQAVYFSQVRGSNKGRKFLTSEDVTAEARPAA